MPVTSFGSSSAPGPGPGSSSAPPVAAMPSDGPVGHGVTRLMARAPAYGVNVKFVPGAPPPRGETAGAHGAHKGRISIR
jgi:hypothetical protein